jgi:hypothetical protein
VLATATIAAASGSRLTLRARMVGYNEVPAVSTTGHATWTATVNGDRVDWTLSYAGLEGDVTQSHIHIGQTSVNGGVSVFLCSNLGNGPAGTQACPPSPATISGSFTAAEVIGPAAQGIATGEFAELIAAIRGGVTYANIHSTKWPGGEARGQVTVTSDQGDQD